ncbi:hypothetical protein POM88_052712 [Heracleum sosnowskyi]|uniref:F-box associated beta-propeller type 1 domain-containing protein n=1 Tax=Heracleum sosnowskyi TaxID=360622 RepID=A0AAD8GRI4_9APIA|nr:hypothetical protein POM88_052712 [Heracleum sosnowskyi]
MVPVRRNPTLSDDLIRHGSNQSADKLLSSATINVTCNVIIFSLLHVDSRKIVADLGFRILEVTLILELLVLLMALFVLLLFVVFNKDEISRSVYLWNPAIRQIKVIPSYSIEFNDKEVQWSSYDGFGYDPIDHDYKVVMILSWRSLSPMHHFLSAEVYSVNKNVWRKEVFNLAIKLPVICDRVRDEACIVEFNKSVGVVILINASNDDKTDRRLDKKINMCSFDDDAYLRGGGVEALWTIMFSIDASHSSKDFSWLLQQWESPSTNIK